MSASVPTSPRRRARWWRGPALALVLVIAFTSPAAAQVTYSGALRTATGTYLFTEKTTSLYIVSAVDAEKGPLRISASVPVIHQSTPWITYAPLIVPSGGGQSANVADQIRRGAGGGAGSTDGTAGAGAGSGPGAPRSASMFGSAATAATVPSGFVVTLPSETGTSQTGFGDVILRASSRLTAPRATTMVRVNGAYKPGLASVERGFGTGAADYGAGVTAMHVRGVNQLSVSAEFWSLGDMPELPLNSALSYRFGYDRYVVSSRWWVSGAVAGWTRVLDGVAPPADVSAGIGRYFSGTGRSVGVTVAFGLTDTSPDFTVALDWRLRL